MKIKHTVRLKEKRAKLKSRKVKKKLKMEQHSISKVSNKFIYGNNTIKSVDNIDTEDAQSIPSESMCIPKERQVTRSSSKRQKKQLGNEKGIHESSDHHNITNNSMECNSERCTDRIVDDDWELINSEEKIDDTDDWFQLGPKEKRNIGVPVVIDVNMDGVTSPSFPGKEFEPIQRTRLSENTFFTNDTFAVPEETNARITVVKSFKPNQSTVIKSFKPNQSTSQIRHQKEKRNIGAPVVIDAIMDGVTSLSFPGKEFEPTRRTRSIENTFYTNDTFAESEESNARITVAKSIKSNESTSQIRHEKQALSVSPSAAKSIEPKQSTSQISRREQPSHVPWSAKMSPKKSVNHSHVTKARNSPQWEIVDEANAQQQHIATTRKPQVYCIRNIVIVIMGSKSRLCFTGKLLVKVLFGAVEIYGSILDRSTGAREVYSPRGYSNVSIETSQTSAEDSIEAVWAALAPRGITRDSESTLQMDIDSVEPGTAILLLQNFENDLTRFLKTFVPSFRLFPSINNPCYYSWMDPKRAEIVLQANLNLEQHDDPNYRRLITHPCITVDIAERMISDWRANRWSCTLIAGGKGVGKSTSVRHLVNSLLRTSGKVVLVDVDPGQAECTPAGCLSCSLIEEPLLGPNFTHLRTPAYQLFLDDVNVSRCVTRYLEGVKMLVERLHECPSLSGFPVVVNTMGFTTNLGWDIAMFTIKLIRPTIILQIMSSKSKNYQDYLSAEVVNKQNCTWMCTLMCCDETFIDWNKPCEHDLCIFRPHTIMKPHKDEWSMEPYQQRELAMISYLSGIVVCDNDNDDSPQYNAELPFYINKAVPFTAPFSSLCIIPQRLFGVPASHVLNVANGNIVALCGVDLTEESSRESENTCGLRVLTQRSPLCTCYGFGIIRGIDTERQEVFINTPLPISIMQHVNCLAGCIPVPPVLLQLNQGAPYVGENARLPTSREVRRGGFRMKFHKKPNNNPNRASV